MSGAMPKSARACAHHVSRSAPRAHARADLGMAPDAAPDAAPATGCGSTLRTRKKNFNNTRNEVIENNNIPQIQVLWFLVCRKTGSSGFPTGSSEPPVRSNEPPARSGGFPAGSHRFRMNVYSVFARVFLKKRPTVSLQNKRKTPFRTHYERDCERPERRMDLPRRRGIEILSGWSFLLRRSWRCRTSRFA
jgi:hypothetical protein